MPFDIAVSGSIKNKQQVAEYAQQVLSQFFTARFQRHVDVCIHFRRQLEPGFHGFCYGDKNELWIDIAKGYTDPSTGAYQCYDFATVLITLAHELVHAKQIIKGQLSDTGKIWNYLGERIDCSTMSYVHLPWEKEANSLETRLYVKHWLDQHSR